MAPGKRLVRKYFRNSDLRYLMSIFIKVNWTDKIKRTSLFVCVHQWFTRKHPVPTTMDTSISLYMNVSDKESRRNSTENFNRHMFWIKYIFAFSTLLLFHFLLLFISLISVFLFTLLLINIYLFSSSLHAVAQWLALLPHSKRVLRSISHQALCVWSLHVRPVFVWVPLGTPFLPQSVG